MQRLALIFLLVTAGSVCSAEEPKRSGGDFTVAASELAPKIAAKIVAKQGESRFRVAVFPVGNRDGKITLETAEGSTVLQGELIFQLIGQAKDKFLVLDKAGLRKEFETAGIDPVGLTANRPEESSKILSKTGIDAAVIGSFDSLGYFASLKEEQKKINISLTVVFKDGSFAQVTGSSIPESDPVPPPINPELSGRFKVEILLRQGKELNPIPLVTSNNPNSAYHGVFFAVVPKTVELGTNKAEFVIRLVNMGTQELPHPEGRYRDGKAYFLVHPKDEKRRLFAAAVLLDGVNSIYQDIGDGRTKGPVIVHPRCTQKWVLCGPGERVVEDTTKKEGYRLVKANGKDGSKVDVPGYQANEKTASAFTFAKPGEGLAEKIGITNDVGMIAVHFYVQKMEGDAEVVKELPRVAGMIGFGSRSNVSIADGRPLPNPVFGIRPDLYKNPVEVWRIFYRSEGQLPKDFPKEEQTPITGEPFKMTPKTDV